MPKYRVAIIGTGRMGGLIEDELATNQFFSPYGHYPAYQAIAETEVIAVANRGQDRLTRFSERFDCDNTYLDYREMIEKEKPDIVSITTPSLARAEPIIFARATRSQRHLRRKGTLRLSSRSRSDYRRRQRQRRGLQLGGHASA